MRLTKRETQILHLITYEYSTDEIASQLFLSKYTILSHRKNILRKLRAKNTAGIVRKGIQLGYVKLGSSTVE